MYVAGGLGGDKMNKFFVEFWWLLERLSGRLWLRACPEDKVSYWLDWLPAFTYVKRTQAERRIWEAQAEQKV